MRTFKLDRGLLHAIACRIERGSSLSWDEVTGALSSVEEVRTVLFRPDFVVGPVQLLAAVDYAARAFRTGQNVARSFHVESFLFAAVTNEIARALRMFQPSFSEDFLYAVVVAENPQRCFEALSSLEERGASVSSFSRDEEAAKRLIKELNISERELRATRASSLAEAVEKCVLSRMAIIFITR